MSDNNPYKILGVKPGASDKEIKVAFRKLAKDLHPDLNPGNSETEKRFKAVSAAYNFLSDKEQRAKFDNGEIDASGVEIRQEPFYRSYAGAGPRHQYHSTQGFSDFSNESDLFAELFGRARHNPNAPQAGADIRYQLGVDFLDAALGAKRRIRISEGQNLDIKIPAGVIDGQILRLKQKGLPGINGGINGDVLVKVSIAQHRKFGRNGMDIQIDFPITLGEAILGGKVMVPTIYGPVSVTLPMGANSGQILRLKGKGIKSAKSGKSGDQLVKLSVNLPETIDDDLLKFMQSWQKKHPYTVRSDFEEAI